MDISTLFPESIRIAHILPTVTIGGLWRHACDLATFAPETIDLRFVEIFRGVGGQPTTVPNAEVFSLNRRLSEYKDINSISVQLTEFLRDGAFDLVHTHHYFSDIYAIPVAREVGIKSVVRTVHGIFQTTADDGFSNTSSRVDWTSSEIHQQLSLEPHCQLTITVSNDLQRKLLSYGFAPGKIRVLPNAIDTTHFSPSSRSADTLTQSKPWSQDNNIVLGFIGRFEPVKNPLFTLKLFDHLCETFPNIILLLVGSGRLLPEIQQYCANRSHRNIFLEPHTLDVRRYLNYIDILLLPSYSEGCPYILLESMAMGVPAVASAVGGITEIISDGVDGFTYSPDCLPEAAAKVSRLITSTVLRRSFSTVAQKKVFEEYNVRKRVPALIKIYRQIMTSLSC